MKSLLFVAWIALSFAVSTVSAQNSECDCGLYDCACCVTSIPVINSACVNLTWDADSEVVVVILDVDGVPVWGEKFTGDAPLSVCQPIESVCEICLGITGLNITSTGACGDLVANATCLGEGLEFDFGDFFMGSDCTVDTEEIIDFEWSKAQAAVNELKKKFAGKKTQFNLM